MKKKYPLNVRESFRDSLVFWIAKYLRAKMLVLSTRLVSDKELYKKYVEQMANVSEFDEIVTINSNLLKIKMDNLSPYYRALKVLYEFLERKSELIMFQDISEELLYECIMINSHYANSTKKVYRNIILSLFKYIEANNSDNYSFGFEINIKSITSSNARIPRFLGKNELIQLKNSINITHKKTHNANFLQYRNALILKLLIYSGMRSCEIAHLKLNDITKSNGYYILTIYGKCSKYRKVAIKRDKIKIEFETFLRLREQIVLPHLEDFLFLSKNGRNISRRSIYGIVKRAFARSNLLSTHRNGGHTIRHSFASLIYKESNNLILLQQLLGHSSIETTRIYTHLDERLLTKGADYLDVI